MTELKNHPLAELFPALGKDEQKDLAADIKKNGLLSKITLLDGMILDGRHRYQACLSVGVEPEFRAQKGDPLTFVLSANLMRRHLTESQRAMVAAKMANLGEGNPAKVNSANLQSTPISQSEAAEKLNVSTRSVASAKKVLDEAPKRDIKAVESGEKSINKVLQDLKEKEPQKEMRDKTNFLIPESIMEDWNRAEEVKDLMAKVSDVRCAVKAALEAEDVIWEEVNNGLIASLNDSFTSLKRVQPFAVCSSCQGHQRKKCALCRGRGFLSEFTWTQCVPIEVKAIRKKASKS